MLGVRPAKPGMIHAPSRPGGVVTEPGRRLVIADSGGVQMYSEVTRAVWTMIWQGQITQIRRWSEYCVHIWITAPC